MITTNHPANNDQELEILSDALDAILKLTEIAPEIEEDQPENVAKLRQASSVIDLLKQLESLEEVDCEYEEDVADEAEAPFDFTEFAVFVLNQIDQRPVQLDSVSFDYSEWTITFAYPNRMNTSALELTALISDTWLSQTGIEPPVTWTMARR